MYTIIFSVDCCETRLCLMNNLLNISDVKRVYKFQGLFINYYTQRFMNNFFVEILFPPLISDCYCDLMVFKSLSNLLRYINVDFITLFISFKALNDQSLKKKFFYYIKVFLTNYILRKKFEIIGINGQSFTILFSFMFFIIQTQFLFKIRGNSRWICCR